jgi:hypothetical protein
LLVAAGALMAAARFSDGPIGLFLGGPFRSGELVTGPEPDWAFAAELATVELQLVTPPRSRTTHVLVHRGQLYIPSGIISVGPFVYLGQVFWKQWPYQALSDPRVVLRIGGKLYERRAARVLDPDLRLELGARYEEKYGIDLPEAPDPEQVWYFRMERPGPERGGLRGQTDD